MSSDHGCQKGSRAKCKAFYIDADGAKRPYFVVIDRLIAGKKNLFIHFISLIKFCTLVIVFNFGNPSRDVWSLTINLLVENMNFDKIRTNVLFR